MKKNLNGRKWKIVLCTLLCTVALFTGCGEEKDENTGKPEPTKGESQEKTKDNKKPGGEGMGDFWDNIGNVNEENT